MDYLHGCVSVVISSYNKGEYIKQTLDSVRKQSYSLFEIIIVDDCSTDGTSSILEDYANRYGEVRVFFNKRNLGANYCRNFGLQKAKGDYIIFLDADDLLMPFCIERRLVVMKESSGLDFAVFPMGVFHYQIGDSTSKWVPNSKRPLEGFLSHQLPWGICQPIWRKAFLLLIGGFDESFSRRQDVDLHTRALLFTGVRFEQIVGEADCFYRVDIKRLNYDLKDFVERSVDSSVQYCRKFFPQAKARKLDRQLIGTIYKTYIWVLYHYRRKDLEKEDFLLAETKLLSALDIFLIGGLKRRLFRLGRASNLFPVRIPGVNWLVFRLVTL